VEEGVMEFQSNKDSSRAAYEFKDDNKVDEA
jgi:hypothetical protein